jgi:hypothetical protein
MCNLYSITTNQEAIRALFRVLSQSCRAKVVNIDYMSANRRDILLPSSLRPLAAIGD